MPTEIGMHLSMLLMRCAHLARFILMGGKMHGVRIIIERDGQVVLVRHHYAPSIWTLPGGGVKHEETSGHAAIREAHEETGLEIMIAGKVGTYTGLGKGDITEVFVAGELTGSLTPTPNIEIKERKWFPTNNLPKNISAANKKVIEAFKKDVRNEMGQW